MQRVHITVKLSQDASATLHSMWHVVSYLLKMLTIIVKEPHNVLLLHSVSISFHTLYDIAFKCSRQ